MERESRKARNAEQLRIEHAPGQIRRALATCEAGTPVAVEATANWYWIVDEIEQAGLVPCLVHPRKAKLMMGMLNSTDRLAAHGLNCLQRNGTLPTVWIPPGHLRRVRELTRGRIWLARRRTALKNRILAMLSKWGLQMQGVSDVFGARSRPELLERLRRLPEEAAWIAGLHMEELGQLLEQIALIEERLEGLLEVTPAMELLQSLPGVGLILSATIALEVGEVERFESAEKLASYAGATPRVHASGGKVHYGHLRPDVNHTLQWAYIEAGNSVALNCRRQPYRHVSRLYWQVRMRKGHSVAVGAVARHLAEASYHVLRRKEPYRDPALAKQQEPPKAKAIMKKGD